MAMTIDTDAESLIAIDLPDALHADFLQHFAQPSLTATFLPTSILRM
jgi:hypothetical protein